MKQLSIVKRDSLDEVYEIIEEGNKYPIGCIYAFWKNQVYLDEARSVEDIEAILGAIKTFLAEKEL